MAVTVDVDAWSSNAGPADTWNSPPQADANNGGGKPTGDAWAANGSAKGIENANGTDYGVDDANLNCTKCGIAGHIKYDCPQPNDENVRPSGCFTCGQDGHNKNECPEPLKVKTCNACGKDGHFRRECPDAEPMTCHGCGLTGHSRRDCPTSGPMLCKNCGEEGHGRLACKNPRKIDRSGVPDVDPEVSWEEMKAAVQERDIDDVKEALQKYFKKKPDVTYLDLHNALRKQEINLWIIATERRILTTFTNMDLQGNLNKKFSISYRFSDKPDRPREKEGWPVGDEIAARLPDAGEVVEVGLPKCTNCDELGHIAKSCTKEKKQEPERAVVMCYNCNETGHRIRDCTVERVDKFACKNCKKSGHRAADCPEPRSAEGVECRKCNEMGHFSRDCPTAGPRGCRNCGKEGHKAVECTEPRNMENVQCRNCDAFGHMSRECLKPRDYSKVTCSNCGMTGHTKVKCRLPPSADANLDGMNAGGDNVATDQPGDFGTADGTVAVEGGVGDNNENAEQWNTNGGDSAAW